MPESHYIVSPYKTLPEHARLPLLPSATGVLRYNNYRSAQDDAMFRNDETGIPFYIHKVALPERVTYSWTEDHVNPVSREQIRDVEARLRATSDMRAEQRDRYREARNFWENHGTQLNFGLNNSPEE
jgi:hypothetical protein